MTAPALEALAAAKASGVKVIRQGDALILEATPKLPPDVVALFKAAKPDLLRIPGGPGGCEGDARRWSAAEGARASRFERCSPTRTRV